MFIIFFILGLSLIAMAADEVLWASKVIEFSSQYGSNSWSAGKVLGEPDTYPKYGDFASTWAPSDRNSGNEFIEVSFDETKEAAGFRIYETYNPGAIKRVLARDTNGTLHTMWEGNPEVKEPTARIFEFSFAKTAYKVASLRVELDTSAVNGWNEVDAIALIPAATDTFSVKKVEITPKQPEQTPETTVPGEILWAEKVVEFSSQYAAKSWSAGKVLGEPDTYPKYGDFSSTWAPSDRNSGNEFLEVSFSKIVEAIGFRIYETYNPGSIERVLARDEDGTLHTLWEGKPEVKESTARIFEFSFAKTGYRVASLRIELDTSVVSGWNELDAIALIPGAEDTSYTVKKVVVTPKGSALVPIMLTSIDGYTLAQTYYYYIGPIVLTDNAGAAYGRLRAELNLIYGTDLELWLMNEAQFDDFSDGGNANYLAAVNIESPGNTVAGFGLKNDATYYVVIDNTGYGLIDSSGRVTFDVSLWAE